MNTKILTIGVIALLLVGIIPYINNGDYTGTAGAVGSRTPDSDNTWSTATDITSNGTETGTVNPLDDLIDLYNVTLNANSTHGDLMFINFTITAVSGMGFIGVYNSEYYKISDGLVWKGVIDYVNLSICALTTGSYYIGVVGYGTGYTYTFTIGWYSTTRTPDSDNTNNTAQTATSGGSYQDSLDPVYDYIDLYNISMTSGATTTEGLIVKLDNYKYKSLFVYSPDGSLRDYSDIISSGNPNTPEEVMFAADQTGNYRMVVQPSNAFTTRAVASNYYLNVTVVPGVPPDTDYNHKTATLVFDGTELNTSFNSQFDKYDYYMIDLNQNDNLTVSILFKDGSGWIDIGIEDSDGNDITGDTSSSTSKGEWGWGIATSTQRYYIAVETLNYMGNYTILFSTSGDNLWFRDNPIQKTNLDKDFAMKEDTVDMSHVNLLDIFTDPDGDTIVFSENPKGTNIDTVILTNGTVKFTPKTNFNGFEVINFSATDIKSNVLYWEVKVTVTPVNDAPYIKPISDQGWYEGVEVDLDLNITDVDGDTLTITDTTALFDVDTVNMKIKFTPANGDVGIHYIWINASDGAEQVSDQFKATILNTNDPPEILKIGGKNAVDDGILELTAYEDQYNNYTVEVYDLDTEAGVNDVITISSKSIDTALEIDQKTGNITFFPTQKHVGTYNAEIIVNDGKGGKDTQNISITVINENDDPAKPMIIVANQEYYDIKLTSFLVEDEDGDIITYTWNFGDGTPVITGQTVDHKYSKAGDYEITLTVSDGNGGSASTTMGITIKSPPEVPSNGGTIINPGTNDTGNINFTEDDTNITTPEGSGEGEGDDKSSLLDRRWFMPVMGLLIIMLIILVTLGGFLMAIKKKKVDRGADERLPPVPQPAGTPGAASPPGPPAQQPGYADLYGSPQPSAQQPGQIPAPAQYQGLPAPAAPAPQYELPAVEPTGEEPSVPVHDIPEVGEFELPEPEGDFEASEKPDILIPDIDVESTGEEPIIQEDPKTDSASIFELPEPEDDSSAELTDLDETPKEKSVDTDEDTE